MYDEEIAYVAGFFDGEGSIDFCPSHRTKGRRLHVSITQKRAPVLQWLKENVGGSITTTNGYSRWHIWSAKAGQFLLLIYPYLKVKKLEAEVALQFDKDQQQRGSGWRRAIDLFREQQQLELLKQVRGVRV